MLRLEKHYGDDTGSPELGSGDGKSRAGKTAKNSDGIGLIAQLRSIRKPLRSLLHASTTPKTATRAPGTEKKVAGDEMASVATVHQNYQIATWFKTQITPKFV